MSPVRFRGHAAPHRLAGTGWAITATVLLACTAGCGGDHGGDGMPNSEAGSSGGTGGGTQGDGGTSGGGNGSASGGSGSTTGGASSTGGTTGGGTGGGAPCALTISPGTSFVEAFDQIEVGDTLCLNDGVYMQAMDVPSGKHVRAVHTGRAEIDGGSVLGVEWSGFLFQMLGEGSSATGLKVHHAGELSDACTIGGNDNVMRAMSCSHGGAHKHKIPLKLSGSGHLVEDSWFYGEGRYVVQCFQGSDMVIRRNIVRWDSTVSGYPDEPNAAMSNYACANMLWENNISLDYGVPETPMDHCGDICLSTTFDVANTNVRYLGMMVVHHDPSTNNNIALRADSKTTGGLPSLGISVRDLFVRDVGIGMVAHPDYQDASLMSCTLINVPGGAGQLGFGAGATMFSCDSMADVSRRYIDGTLTNDPLFPFPNEALAKADMCAPGERASDWCDYDGSLESYILGQ